MAASSETHTKNTHKNTLNKIKRFLTLRHSVTVKAQCYDENGL